MGWLDTPNGSTPTDHFEIPVELLPTLLPTRRRYDWRGVPYWSRYDELIVRWLKRRLRLG